MATVLDVEAAASTMQSSRTISEKKLRQVIHGLRLMRAMVNTIEAELEHVLMDGLTVPSDESKIVLSIDQKEENDQHG